MKKRKKNKSSSIVPCWKKLLFSVDSITQVQNTAFPVSCNTGNRFAMFLVLKLAYIYNSRYC